MSNTSSQVITSPFLTVAQIWEWYGCEENVGDTAHGRYKPKGGEEFILELSYLDAIYNSEEITRKLNEKYNKDGMFYKHEFKGDFEPYSEPTRITLEG